MTHRKVVNLNQFTEHKNLHKVSQLSEKVEKVPWETDNIAKKNQPPVAFPLLLLWDRRDQDIW